MRPVARALLPLLLATACATPPPVQRATSRIRAPLVERGQLAPEIRQRLHERMDRHGTTLDDLVWSVVLLDREQTSLLAAEIALWQSAFGELEGAVPARFGELERELRAETELIGRLAQSHTTSDEQIGRAFGRLAATCVSCHATYLYGEAAP